MAASDEIMEQLFSEYHNMIYRFLLLMTNSKEEAEDLTQEVFIRAYHAMDTFKQESSYKTWLYSIARNIAYDHYRKKRTLKFFKGTALPERTEAVPEEILEMKEQTQDLYQVISELKMSFREILILRKIKGYSIHETAEILGWSEAKVKTTLHRAMNALKTKLDDKGWRADGQSYFFG